jgi:hypothetical protein
MSAYHIPVAELYVKIPTVLNKLRYIDVSPPTLLNLSVPDVLTSSIVLESTKTILVSTTVHSAGAEGRVMANPQADILQGIYSLALAE